MKQKIINDPVHGFITIDDDLLLRLLSHPWVQRLRRIRQLGMTSLVYPGAQHTRFQHATGAMHLMQLALDTLSSKGVLVLQGEQRAALAAILLHDVGHGPFSHALEHLMVNVDHEVVSDLIMERLNSEMGGGLDLCINIFAGRCRPFLHELISSQLDTDRLDYLKRDSFFSGVVEGAVGADRIIKMLDVTPDGHLGIEAKGIYTIEDFLVARRLMYWQVYLHKTVVAAEEMLRMAVRRARNVLRQGGDIEASKPLLFFLANDIDEDRLRSDPGVLPLFCDIDDDDVNVALKCWARSDDKLLAFLSHSLVDRRLFHIEMSREPVSAERVEAERCRAERLLDLDAGAAEYLVRTGQVSSRTYNIGVDHINIIFRDHSVKDISQASDMMRLETLGNADRRFYISLPRWDEY